VVLVVVNKRTDAGVTAAVALDAAPATPATTATTATTAPLSGARAYQYAPQDAAGATAIRDVGSLPLEGRSPTVWLPPASITTIRLTR
jgi:hypothetical protein